MEAPLQRILARATRAKRNAAKRLKNQELEEFKDQKANWKMSSRFRDEEIRSHYKREARNRREDWDAGPRLIPRRDIGVNRTAFGTISRNLDYPPVLPEPWRTKPMFAVGDRVVLLKGADKGKIGKVKSVETERQIVEVEGLNRFNYVVPEWMAQEDKQNYTPTVYSERAILWDDVKLVTRVTDQAGLTRDVVVEQMEIRKGKGKDADQRGERWIPGLEKRIAWPDKNKTPEEAEAEDTDSDTLRLTVDEATFTPTLQRPPMPPSVLDELRGKYSKFRTRHDPEYIAQKEAEAASIQQRKQGLKILGMTPMEKSAAEYRASKAGSAPLTKEQLAAIGEVIAREKAQAGKPSSAS
ncbi:hypothetical protein C1H76_9281 [Elsinoe australis]|uniref:KOW domain-containing protein n=1 Tax=Elsinoe australis TaxID=40998 RepID=A0A4V6DU81_9PEZI|nr:hypothetical protein C1H76_9281 [Elsinoe australis]